MGKNQHTTPIVAVAKAQQFEGVAMLLLQINMLSWTGGIAIADLGDIGKNCVLLVEDIKSLLGTAPEELQKCSLFQPVCAMALKPL